MNQQQPTTTPERVVHYAPNMRRAPLVNTEPDGWPANRSWHAEAILDTGTSHVMVGRPYVIACEWCPQVFIANTQTEALDMFRAHEAEVSR